MPQFKLVGDNRKVFSTFWIGLYKGNMHQTVFIDNMVYEKNIAEDNIITKETQIVAWHASYASYII